MAQGGPRRAVIRREAPMDLADVPHGPRSFLTRYVWSQDHKVIAVQYAGTAIAVGLVGLALSNLMRLQIGSGGLSSSTPSAITSDDARDDHGHLPAHGVVSRRLRQLPVR
jgi:hypothetical protein